MENGDENGSQDNLRVDHKFEWWSSIPRMVVRNTGLISIGESHFYDLDDEWKQKNHPGEAKGLPLGLIHVHFAQKLDEKRERNWAHQT